MTPVRALLGMATVALLATASPSSAAPSAVYGGHVPRGEPIVVTADAKFQKLQTMVVASELTCPGGDWMPYSIQLTAAKPLPGFDPANGTLKMTKNAKGKFAGRYIQSGFSPQYSYAWIVDIGGKLTKATASGTFDIVETVIDNASGEEVASCYSGKTKFVASRSAGKVFGGMTKQQEPVVIQVDAKRHKIKNFYFSWIAGCGDQGYYHKEFMSWQDVSMTGAGAFKITDMWPWRADDGSMSNTSYSVNGKVGAKSAIGNVTVKVDEFDASGAATLSCTSGQLKWSAITG